MVHLICADSHMGKNVNQCQLTIACMGYYNEQLCKHWCLCGSRSVTGGCLVGKQFSVLVGVGVEAV